MSRAQANEYQVIEAVDFVFLIHNCGFCRMSHIRFYVRRYITPHTVGSETVSAGAETKVRSGIPI